MLNFIERLRQKPKALRAQIVFVSAAVITGIIFFIWLSVISMQFRSIAPPEEEGERGSGTATSFADIQEDISLLFDLEKIELQIEELQTEFSSGALPETESGVNPSDQELEFIEEGVREQAPSVEESP